MCDSMGEVNALPLIDARDNQAAKERLSKEILGDETVEINKDTLPELPDKTDFDNAASKEVVEHLASGLISIHLEDLKKMSTNLNELMKNQSIVIETLQQENTRFSETLKIYNLDDVFTRAKHYHTKLQQIKKEMALVHERSTKLKKRALRLQQQKQKEALYKEQQRDRELERDKQLAPKLATKS